MGRFEILYDEEKNLFHTSGWIEKSQMAEMKRLGWRFNPEEKHWCTYDADRVIPFSDRCTGSALKALRNYQLSRATDSTAHIWEPLCPPSLRGYQRAGVEFILNNDNTLLADPMGLGKTAQVLGAMCVFARQRRAEAGKTCVTHCVVVCPAHLKNVWIDEILKFCNVSVWVNRFDGHSKRETMTVERSNEAILIVHLINYDVLERRLIEIEKYRPFHFIVFDESHYLKNLKAKRTKAAFKLVSLRADGGKVIFISGTPVTKNPMDLYPILSMVKHPVAKGWYPYARRFCAAERVQVMGRWVWKFSTSNGHRLNSILRHTIMVRREKDEVLRELPPKVRQIIALEPRSVFTPLLDQERLVLAAQRLSVEDFERRNISLPLPAARKLADIRQRIAIHKIPHVLAFVSSILEQDDEKVVVFAHHRSVIEALEKVFEAYGVAVIHGDVPPEDRSIIVQSFQSCVTPRVLVASLTCAGTGITLSSASYAVFAELDWIPATVEQAEDRIHRIGQTSTAFVYYFVVEGSLEHYIAKRMLDRSKQIDTVLNTNEGGGNGRV